MTDSSYYDVLEVHSDSTSEEICIAYERQLQKLNSLPQQTHEWRIRYDEVIEAFQVLGSSERRERYDQRALGKALPDSETDVGPDQESRNSSSNLPARDPDFRGLRKTTSQTFMLSRARQTPEGYEISLKGSGPTTSGVVLALKERIPEEELKFDAVRQVWLVPLEYVAELETLFLNFSSVLLRSQEPLRKLTLPHFSTAADKAVAPENETFRGQKPTSGGVYTASQFPIQGTIIAVLVLLIAWNLIVAGTNQELDTAGAVPTPRATRLPIVTPTHTPTMTPTPFSFITSTRYPRVHLRSLPDVESVSLGYLEAGDSFTVLGRTPDKSWVRVRRGEKLGWSAAWTLNVDDRIDQLPILQVTPDARSQQN